MFDYMYILYLLFVSVFFTWFVCLPVFHFLSIRFLTRTLRFRLSYAVLLLWNISDTIILNIFSNSLHVVTFSFVAILLFGYVLYYLMEEVGIKRFFIVVLVAFLSKYPAILAFYLINNFLQ